MQALRQARTLGARLSKNGRSYHKVEPWKVPNMDELPVPSGSWKAHNEAQQRKNNLTFFTGLVVLIGTAITFKSNVYFNFLPPDSIE